MAETALGPRFVTAVRQSLGIGAYTLGALTGSQYQVLLGLRSATERAIDRGLLDEAERLAQQYLDLAHAFPTDWYHGNGVHHAHRLLGQIALERGDTEAAARELLASGTGPSSPQLASFGPNMSLAKALLERGERDVVLDYLKACRTMWTMSGAGPSREHPLDRWERAITAGLEPDFGPNLMY